MNCLVTAARHQAHFGWCRHLQVPLPNPKFQPEAQRWRPGTVAPSLEVHSQICAFFWPKTAIFKKKGSTTQPNWETHGKQTSYAATGLLCLGLRGPLVTSNSMIGPRDGPKMAQKGPKCAVRVKRSPNQEQAISWVTWLKHRFRGHLVHPQPRPTFCGLHRSELPNEMPRLLYW